MNVAANIAAELRDRIGLLAVERVGAEPTLRTRQTWRFHPRGGLAIEVGGQRHGLWCDHAAGVGGDGLDLVQHLRGGSVTDALAWSRSWLGHTPGQLRPAAPAPGPGLSEPAPSPGLSEADNGQDRRRKQESAQQVRQHAVDAAGTDVERYLASRDLTLPAGHHDVLRYHQHCPRGESSWSAMVGLVCDPETGEAYGVHRSYLSLSGAGKASGVARPPQFSDDGGMRRRSGPTSAPCSQGSSCCPPRLAHGEQVRPSDG